MPEVREAAVVEEVARAKRDLDRLRDLDQQCREASEEADREKAGMREVALFRAANAKAVMGGYAVGLAERLVAALEEVAAVAAYRATQDGGAEEAVRRVEALADEWLRKSSDSVWHHDVLLEHADEIRAALAPQAEDGAR